MGRGGSPHVWRADTPNLELQAREDGNHLRKMNEPHLRKMRTQTDGERTAAREHAEQAATSRHVSRQATRGAHCRAQSAKPTQPTAVYPRFLAAACNLRRVVRGCALAGARPRKTQV